MDCRINKALELCDCLPYLYRGIIHNRFEYDICDTSGLACLWKNKWRDFTCDCPKQCENYILQRLQTREMKSVGVFFKQKVELN